MELSISGSQTYGVTERTLDHREDDLRQDFLVVESLIDSRIMCVINGRNSRCLG